MKIQQAVYMKRLNYSYLIKKMSIAAGVFQHKLLQLAMWARMICGCAEMENLDDAVSWNSPWMSRWYISLRLAASEVIHFLSLIALRHSDVYGLGKRGNHNKGISRSEALGNKQQPRWSCRVKAGVCV